jgi:retinol dehydrogenase-12
MSEATLAGKTAVVTGATAGIGQVVAQTLAARGAAVLVVARDPGRMRATLASLAPPASGAHAVFAADLSSLIQTRRVAGEIGAEHPVIDILINNAGGVFPVRQATDEGLERTFALNHMSYFVLTEGLLERVKAAPQGRVVSTASRMHSMGKLDFDDMQMTRGYEAYAAYGRSKLCNILFTRALARRLAGTAVTANALHPGFVATAFGDNDRTALGTLFKWMKVFAISPEAGAATTLHVATSEEGGRLSGAYFVKSKPTEPSPAARNDADGERLWALSAELAAAIAP